MNSQRMTKKEVKVKIKIVLKYLLNTRRGKSSKGSIPIGNILSCEIFNFYGTSLLQILRSLYLFNHITF